VKASETIILDIKEKTKDLENSDFSFSFENAVVDGEV